MADFLHTMVRITDPESRAFYEALGFTFSRDMDIVRYEADARAAFAHAIGLTLRFDPLALQLAPGSQHCA
jgi:hypothetical protein